MTDINPASWVSRMMQKDGAGSSNLQCQVALDKLRCARSMQMVCGGDWKLRRDSGAIFKFLLVHFAGSRMDDVPSTACQA